MEKIGKYEVGDIVNFCFNNVGVCGMIIQRDIAQTCSINVKPNSSLPISEVKVKPKTETEVWYKVVVLNDDKTLGQRVATRFRENEIWGKAFLKK